MWALFGPLPLHPTLLCPNPDSEASTDMQQPPSRPFIHTLASPAEHQWLVPICVICLCGSSVPLPWRTEDCFALSSFCPDLFHFRWRLTPPRQQPVKFSVPLYAELPEPIQPMTSRSSLTTLPGSLQTEQLVQCTCLSRYVSSIGRACYSLKKNLVNSHQRPIVCSIQYSKFLFWKVAGCNYQSTKYSFECKERSIIF